MPTGHVAGVKLISRLVPLAAGPAQRREGLDEVRAEEVALLTMDVPSSEKCDCAAESIGFATSHEAYVALRLHNGHRPECTRYLAAHAYVSDNDCD